MELESAIPSQLQTQRSIPSKLPPKYQPPFPAYTARWPANVKDLVMAIIGAQYRSKPASNASATKLISFVETEAASNKPKYWELAAYTDNRNHYNEAVIAYWQNRDSYNQWASSKILFPAIDHFETVFSDNAADEGASYMKEKISGPIAEHVYWGSMRDRLPASQSDEMKGETWHKSNADGALKSDDTRKSRIRVRGHENLAVIRSGQDWAATLPNERKLYLETMHPVLTKGMDFLRDHGEEVGCISNRFMTVVNSKPPANSADKTFGLGYFDDLASLENWSKLHKTHLDIFGGFLKYAKELQNNISLRLFHEVTVVASGQQEFEYVACHPGTGMLPSR